MDDTRNPLATRFLAFKELRCCPISGYNHWAAENQWIHRLMPLSSQATVQSIHHICYQKLPATTGKCFFFFFFNHFPRCGHYYSCWHHFSDTNITNEILFLCSSCLTLWAWQCFLGLHRNSCQKSGLDYSNIPGWDRAIFHREAYLISTLGNLFTSLFSREQSSNFRPSGGLFNHRVPPSTFSFSLFSLLVVFFFFYHLSFTEQIMLPWPSFWICSSWLLESLTLLYSPTPNQQTALHSSCQSSLKNTFLMYQNRFGSFFSQFLFSHKTLH